MKKLLFLVLALSSFSYGQSASGSITTNGSTCAVTNVCVQLPLNNAGTVAVAISGTFTGTVSFEASGNNNLSAVAAINCTPLNSTTAVTTATAVGTFQCNAAGLTNFQVRGSAAMTGAAVVNLNATPASIGGGSGGGGSTTFDLIGSGTNTTATMTCTSPCVLNGTGVTAGAVAFNNVTAGTNINALLIGASGTFGPTSTGIVTANALSTATSYSFTGANSATGLAITAGTAQSALALTGSTTNFAETIAAGTGGGLNITGGANGNIVASGNIASGNLTMISGCSTDTSCIYNFGVGGINAGYAVDSTTYPAIGLRLLANNGMVTIGNGDITTFPILYGSENILASAGDVNHVTSTGNSLIVASGQGTGNAIPSDYEVSNYALIAATNGTPKTRIITGIQRHVVTGLTNAAFSDIVDFWTQTASWAGGSVNWCAEATDTTNYQMTCGEVSMACVNKAGTVTAASPSILGTAASVATSGTQTITFNATTTNDSSTFTIDTAGNSGAVRAVNVVTYKTTANHGFVVGQPVSVTGVTDITMNGVCYVATTDGAKQFTCEKPGNSGTSGGGSVYAFGKCTLQLKSTSAVLVPTTINAGAWISSVSSQNGVMGK